MTTTARARGAPVWLTGLPSAGKTTIARILGTRLKAERHRVEVLDGDEVRRFLSAGLGFSREDRNTNVQRIGLVAEVLTRNGVLAVVPVIAPYADSRDAVRERHEASGTPYIEVHVATPVEVCSERDVKGARSATTRDSWCPERCGSGTGSPSTPPVRPPRSPASTCSAGTPASRTRRSR
ncbi:adenylyl-sulfate kinase [Streptomyces mirabilis]|jgi:adenylylsulfate kinase|uniref:adenylyl-sulfate kinase n=1 Tax=Streptomyces mirabilis TaxID=68239 RepID=UPI0009A11584|nr:adenylyl-sulfate kinase [Streptomyces mirabilis]